MKKSFYMYIVVGIVFILFLSLRLISLSNVSVLDGHDSVFYLHTIETFRTCDIKEIINIDPDASLTFAFAGALLSIMGWSIETSARLVSLVSIIGIFIIAYIAGKRFHSMDASVTGLVLISLNPVLVGLSVAVRTEPLYVVMVYSGLVLFIMYHRNLNLMPAFLTGIVFGLAFLTRLEGILFLVFIPLVQAVYLLIEKRFKTDLKRYAAWSALFLTGFLIIASIQVSWASYKMGMLAVDGRQVWTLIIHQPDDRPYSERLLGLDYSPAEPNIGYLKSNPRALHVEREGDLGSTITEYTKTVIVNLHDLYNNRLADLVGFMILIFFALGITTLYKSGKIFEIILIFMFIIAGLLPPLLHNVVIRHILVISPIILIVAGIGLYSTIHYILYEIHAGRIYRYSLLLIIFALLLSVWAIPLNSTLKMPTTNRDYEPKMIEELITIINKDNEFKHDVAIAARRGYLAYYSGSQGIVIPYTDYKGFVNYCKLNNVDYVLLEHRIIEDFPFVGIFNDGSYEDDFILLHETTDRYGDKLSLFRFISDEL